MIYPYHMSASLAAQKQQLFADSNFQKKIPGYNSLINAVGIKFDNISARNYLTEKENLYRFYIPGNHIETVDQVTMTPSGTMLRHAGSHSTSRTEQTEVQDSNG
jgi:hypothetical protein